MPLWFGVPGLLICCVGFVALATRLRGRDARPVALTVLAFPPAYFWFISNQSLTYGRYALPLVPFLAVAFGVGLAVLAQVLRKRIASPIARRVAVAALFLPLIPPLGYSVSLNANRRIVSPSEQAARWLVANVRTGERVVVEGQALLQLPSRRIAVTPVNKIVDRSLEQYVQEGFTYLVTASSEYQTRDPARAGAYLAIFKNTQQVQAFDSPDTNSMPTIRILKIVR